MANVRITEKKETFEPLILKPDILYGDRSSKVVSLFRRQMYPKMVARLKRLIACCLLMITNKLYEICYWD
jgi:hypothetical protein